MGISRPVLYDGSGKLGQLRKLAAKEVIRAVKKICNCRFTVHETEIEKILQTIYFKQEQLYLRYRRELEGLTPGGSEFVDEPENCSSIARDRMKRQKDWALLCKELGIPIIGSSLEDVKKAISFCIEKGKETGRGLEKSGS